MLHLYPGMLYAAIEESWGSFMCADVRNEEYISCFHLKSIRRSSTLTHSLTHSTWPDYLRKDEWETGNSAGVWAEGLGSWYEKKSFTVRGLSGRSPPLLTQWFTQHWCNLAAKESGLECACVNNDDFTVLVSGGSRCHWVSMCAVWLSHSKWLHQILR